MDHLHLGLTLSANHSPCLSSESISSDNCNLIRKRRFKEEAFDDDEVQATLPLFRTGWENDPNEEDDEYKELDKNSSINHDGDESDNEGMVGRPPINTRRKKLHPLNIGCGNLTRNNVCCSGWSDRGGGSSVSGNLNSRYVKLKMEGVAIGRKVDLSLHHSYHTLAQTLFAMFGTDEESMKYYELTYQDTDGDWLLAGDIPWRSFTETAQSLKLIRRSN